MIHLKQLHKIGTTFKQLIGYATVVKALIRKWKSIDGQS